MDAKTQADNASSSVRTPPKPRCALEVAVVGNRRFAKETDAAPNPAADAMKQRAQDACGHVWRVIRNAMFSALDLRVPLTAPLPSGGSVPRTLYQRDFFTVEPPRLGVLTALAAGADQFAAQAALTLQVPIRTGTLPATPPD